MEIQLVSAKYCHKHTNDTNVFPTVLIDKGEEVKEGVTFIPPTPFIITPMDSVRYLD